MPDVIRWSAEVTVPDGPTVSMTSSFVAAGHDVTEATAAADNTAVPIPIAPGTWDEVALIAITATRYDAAVTYDLGEVTGVALDGPQLFVGAGMLSVLHDPDADPPVVVADLNVTNNSDDPVTVTVVVGRRPPP